MVSVQNGWFSLSSSAWRRGASKVGSRLGRRPVGRARPGWKATDSDWSRSARAAMRVKRAGSGFCCRRSVIQATSPARLSDSWRLTADSCASKKAQPTAACMMATGRMMISTLRPYSERGSQRLASRRPSTGQADGAAGRGGAKAG